MFNGAGPVLAEDPVRKASSPAMVKAKEQEEYTIALRRSFHRIPEVRWEEKLTFEKLRSEISGILSSARPLRWKASVTEKRGGLWVDLAIPSPAGSAGSAPINKQNCVVVFRADCDGLPVQEATGLPFASVRKGFMHACGHDFHMAMLLGALRAIVAGGAPVGRGVALRFVFQRAEENPLTPSGGDVLVNEEGVLDGVAACFGLHVIATHTRNLFAAKPGPLMANSDRLSVKITATGGHASAPHRSPSALRAAVAVVEGLRGFNPLGPLQPLALVPTILRSGEATNVIPSFAELWFGLRSFVLPAERAALHRAVEEKVRQLVAAYASQQGPRGQAAGGGTDNAGEEGGEGSGVAVSVGVVEGHPVLVNAPSAFAFAHGALARAGLAVQRLEQPSLGGEDFAHYTLKRPGCYFFLGAGQAEGEHEGEATSGDHHSPTFRPHEACLVRGVAYWLALAANLSSSGDGKVGWGATSGLGAAKL